MVGLDSVVALVFSVPVRKKGAEVRNFDAHCLAAEHFAVAVVVVVVVVVADTLSQHATLLAVPPQEVKYKRCKFS